MGLLLDPSAKDLLSAGLLDGDFVAVGISLGIFSTVSLGDLQLPDPSFSFSPEVEDSRCDEWNWPSVLGSL